MPMANADCGTRAGNSFARPPPADPANTKRRDQLSSFFFGVSLVYKLRASSTNGTRPLKNGILLENYYLPNDLEAQVANSGLFFRTILLARCSAYFMQPVCLLNADGGQPKSGSDSDTKLKSYPRVRCIIRQADGTINTDSNRARKICPEPHVDALVVANAGRSRLFIGIRGGQ
jgi:hypothetical protein